MFGSGPNVSIRVLTSSRISSASFEESTSAPFPIFSGISAISTISTISGGNKFPLPSTHPVFIAIDQKSFYASVECVSRSIDPLKANLLVADASRSNQTICLAVSPALKAIGVPSRPRLFEAKQAIRAYERSHHTRVYYYTATPNRHAENAAFPLPPRQAKAPEVR